MSDGEPCETTTCPVLLLTPEVEEAFAWFYETHELEGGGDRPPAWRRTVLPAAGGVAEQDARLMATLDYLRTILNARLPRPARTE